MWKNFMSDVIAFIFARGGSKGLPGKNILNFCGKPLIAWSIEHAKSSSRINRVIVSTDCKDIAEIALLHGAEVPFIRPSELAQDDTPEWLAWQHALRFIKEKTYKFPKMLVSIPTTSPLRSVDDIDACIDLFERRNPDAVITVSEARRNPYFNMVCQDDNGCSILACPPIDKIYTRQNSPKIFDMTTVAYVVNPNFVMKKKSLFDGIVYHIQIPYERAFDIDNKIDFDFAELLMMRKQQGNG